MGFCGGLVLDEEKGLDVLFGEFPVFVFGKGSLRDSGYTRT